MKIRYLFTILMHAFFMVGVSQISFFSQKNKELFELLPDNCKHDFVASESTSQCKVNDNITINCKKENGKITNIGLSLFDKNEMSLFPEDVYRFIESFFFEYLFTPDFKTFCYINKDNKVFLYFNGNSINRNSSDSYNPILHLLSNKISIKALKQDSIIYTFILSNNSDSLRLLFPANNSLIKGMDKLEMDSYLETQLKNCKPYEYDIFNQNGSSFNKNGNIYILPGTVYHKSINSNTYYLKDDNDYILLFDKDYYLETLANIFINGQKDSNKKLNINHRMYGGISSYYSVNINDFVGFFKDNQFDIYFGVENGDSNNIKATVVINNPYLNFLDLLYIETNKDDIFNKNAFNVKLYSNIPSDNIKDLYGIYQDN